MGRYDRKRSNKSNKSTFLVFPILIALLIGIGGTLYIIDNNRRFNKEELIPSGEVPSNKIADADEFPDVEPLPIEAGLEIIKPQPKTLSGNNTQQAALPDLLSSDDEIRKAIISISPGLAQWLGVDQLIRRFVVIINDFAQSSRIARHMSFLRVDEPFAVDQDENGFYIAPKSFHRYDKLTQTIQAIDTKSAVALYLKFRPLMMQVYAEFNYPQDVTLESIVKKAVAEVLATPIIEGQVNLVRPSVYYKFADTNLEGLNPVQKQIIRMGPENTRIIQMKCREFLVELAKSGVNS